MLIPNTLMLNSLKCGKKKILPSHVSTFFLLPLQSRYSLLKRHNFVVNYLISFCNL